MSRYAVEGQRPGRRYLQQLKHPTCSTESAQPDQALAPNGQDPYSRELIEEQSVARLQKRRFLDQCCVGHFFNVPGKPKRFLERTLSVLVALPAPTCQSQLQMEVDGGSPKDNFVTVALLETILLLQVVLSWLRRRTSPFFQNMLILFDFQDPKVSNTVTISKCRILPCVMDWHGLRTGWPIERGGLKKWPCR